MQQTFTIDMRERKSKAQFASYRDLLHRSHLGFKGICGHRGWTLEQTRYTTVLDRISRIVGMDIYGVVIPVMDTASEKVDPEFRRRLIDSNFDCRWTSAMSITDVSSDHLMQARTRLEVCCFFTHQEDAAMFRMLL